MSKLLYLAGHVLLWAFYLCLLQDLLAVRDGNGPTIGRAICTAMMLSAVIMFWKSSDEK